jgi:hypothetical protein
MKMGQMRKIDLYKPMSGQTSLKPTKSLSFQKSEYSSRLWAAFNFVSSMLVNPLGSIGLILHHVHPGATNLLLHSSPSDIMKDSPFLCYNNNPLNQHGAKERASRL